jgi:hypothetical protein
MRPIFLSDLGLAVLPTGLRAGSSPTPASRIWGGPDQDETGCPFHRSRQLLLFRASPELGLRGFGTSNRAVDGTPQRGSKVLYEWLDKHACWICGQYDDLLSPLCQLFPFEVWSA